ncbi:MAG TPA: hypothetical protein VK631_10455, partial [Solirubrobacteraceae bacterium]|nr:hypothetical protein [Solirubrobacteraceae bacterium]
YAAFSWDVFSGMSVTQAAGYTALAFVFDASSRRGWAEYKMAGAPAAETPTATASSSVLYAGVAATFRPAIPTADLATNDMFLDKQTGDVYQFVGGAWQFVMSI